MGAALAVTSSLDGWLPMGTGPLSFDLSAPGLTVPAPSIAEVAPLICRGGVMRREGAAAAGVGDVEDSALQQLLLDESVLLRQDLAHSRVPP